ncbi:Fic family protein [Pseudomonas sp. PS02302]
MADRKSFRERYLRPALDAGLIAMTRPDKPNSRLQCYYLTGFGKQVAKQK